MTHRHQLHRKHSPLTVATALLCASLALPGQAQPAATAKAPPGERNLQVQATAPVAINNAQRFALVIGNSDYRDAPLSNPVNDARAIAAALKESGFTVMSRENTDQRGMLAALREFGDHLRAGGTGLFYYAGHGMQIKGRNYLIPVGANIEREDEVAYSAVDAQAVLDKMEAAGNVANIMILDACRNNPFTRSMRSGQAGLAQMDAPVGTLVAYATSPGAVASDGAGANGLYTQHLLTAIREPGNKVEDVFKQVRANVRRDSAGKQVPWESTSLEGDFYFKLRPATVAPVAVDPALALESALWDAVKDSSLPIEVRAYLNRYPKGRFAEQAQERLKQLQVAATTATGAAVPLATDQAKAEAARKASAELAKAEAMQLEQRTRAQAQLVVAAEVARARDQAAARQRKDEQLTSLAKPATPQVATAAAPVKLSRPLAASNKNGFTVGDRWRYQVVDKFKKEVVRNWSRKVDAVNSDGSLKLNGGTVDWASDGSTKAARGDGGFLREYSPAMPSQPSSLKIGFSEPVKLTLAYRNADGVSGTEELEGTITVLAKETIKVPAGEFETLKIELSVTTNGKNSSSGTGYYQRTKQAAWYVPALRNYVALEVEVRNRTGQLLTFERNELTSFSVHGAELLAQH